MRQLVLGLFLMGSTHCLNASDALADAKCRLLSTTADETVVAKSEPAKRFHHEANFKKYQDISFKEDLGGKARQVAVNRAKKSKDSMGRGDLAIADATLEQRSIQVSGGHLHAKPVTNDEYYLFIQDTSHPAPKHWKNGKYLPATKDKAVVNVSYNDAASYAKWANKNLPSQNEWMSAADQLSWDLEMPKNEWTSSTLNGDVGGNNQIILNQNGSVSTLNPSMSNLDTGFRVVSSNPLPPLPQLRGDSFTTPDGNSILPDDDEETPDGNDVFSPSDNPYDYGN
jgi:hypothetical protein